MSCLGELNSIVSLEGGSGADSTSRKANFSTVDFETFLKILNRPNGFRDPGEPEEFVRGFQVFDKDMTGYVGVGELKYGTYPSSFDIL